MKILSFKRALLRISIVQEVEDTMDILAIKNLLKTNETIKMCMFMNYTNITQEDKVELQKIVDSHPSIVGLRVSDTFIEPKGKEELLKPLVKSSLHDLYEEYDELKEVSVILMGDGRTGKTSLLRNLSQKSFQQETKSTLVMEDTQIFQVYLNIMFKPLTKYDLSVQRVKNMIDCEYSLEDEVPRESKYNLEFEDELITRAVRENSFVAGYTTSYYSGFTRPDDTFLRVYDFGGQEVFSSVHHIFMKEKALYLVVFNLTKLTEKDIFRLKFWCESILRSAPKAPVVFIGTFLYTFLKKNGEGGLQEVNETIEKVISKLLKEINVVRNYGTVFFPVENAVDSNMGGVSEVKELLMQLGDSFSNISEMVDSSIYIKSVYVLFLDNCREESNYMSLQRFKLKARKCNFSKEEMEEMLELYTKAGIISYFADINLSETENFIFFAPSFLAQAVGSFIRDESFHQLAFRTTKKVFSNYRKYIDTGIIRKDLFDVLLKQYTKTEKDYVLNIAIQSLILFVDPREKNSFIVPELLPDLKNSKLRISWKPEFVVKTENPMTLQDFLQIVCIFLKRKELQESFLFKFFVRIIYSPDEIVNIFVIKEREVGFSFNGKKTNSLLIVFMQQMVEEGNRSEEEVEEYFDPR
eukprot:snap_masked-scaffold_4-processed-gene-8.21-mRNA-1 protein AED:1.00 eAED:1.00 QI:0/0/0/0/1/1/3/0/637